MRRRGLQPHNLHGPTQAAYSHIHNIVAPNIALTRARAIFPDAVSGNASVNATRRGHLYPAR